MAFGATAWFSTALATVHAQLLAMETLQSHASQTLWLKCEALVPRLLRC
jgi:hypothetical protein